MSIIEKAEHSAVSNNLNSLNDIIYFADSTGKIQEVYGNWFRINDLNTESILNSTIGDFFGNDSSDTHQKRHNQCLKNGSVIYEWSFRLSNKTIHFQSSLNKIYNENYYGIIGVIRDITRQKEIDQFYKELELSFKALTNSANYGIISINENKVIEYSNPAASIICGYSEEELNGNEIDKIFLNQSDFYDFMEFYIKNKFFSKSREVFNDQPVEIILKTKDNNEIFAEITLSTYDVLNVTHFLILIQDITLRKKTERELNNSKEKLTLQNKNLEAAFSSLKTAQSQLIHSEKLASLGQITAGISHEINNPLTFISSNINRFNEYFNDIILILDKWHSYGLSFKNSSGNNKLINEISELEKQIDLDFIRTDFSELMKYNLEGIERIKKIVQQLRGFSYSEDNNYSEENINNTIEETLTLVWNEIKYKAEIIRNFGELPVSEYNLNELKQVFVNLLINAAHAIKAKGKITIDTFVKEDNIIIRISDNGCGIPPENINKIYDPFFTTKPAENSSGLGLWICMSIIKKHQGSLKVSSELGKGIMFEINLPIKQNRNEKPVYD